LGLNSFRRCVFYTFYFYKIAATQFIKKKHDTKISMVWDTLVVVVVVQECGRQKAVQFVLS
jgi:hypothetical protein